MGNERYVQMGCSCGAEWIEDRLEAAAICPWCGLKLTWDHLADSDRMGVAGPCYIDMSPDDFQQIMQTAHSWRLRTHRAAVGTTRRSGRTSIRHQARFGS